MKIIRWLATPGLVVFAVGFASWAVQSDALPLEVVPLVAAVLSLPMALGLEWLLPARDTPPEPGETRADLAYLVLSGAVAQPLGALVASGVAVAIAGYLEGSLSSWSLASQILVVVVVMELGTYLAHRAGHGLPWLWRFHAVHHAPATMHALNNPRMHPVELAVRTCLTLAPLLILGVGPEALAWHGAVHAVHVWFGHLNADLETGLFDRIVMTPNVHRWHHAASAEEGGLANYGGMLVVFDQLFGTYWNPGGDGPQTMGWFGSSGLGRHQVHRQIAAPFCWERCQED